MSIIWSNIDGWLLCHSLYLRKIYSDVECEEVCVNCGRYQIFHINSPFLRTNQKHVSSTELSRKNDCKNPSKTYINKNFRYFEINNIKKKFENFILEVSKEISYFSQNCEHNENGNKAAIIAANHILSLRYLTNDDFQGGNLSNISIVIQLQENEVIIPPSCKFYQCDVHNLEKKLLRDNFEPFDVIVIDPPWRNKFIRRKNAHSGNKGYQMVKSIDLLKIPINKFLSSSGLIAVWCTNSEQIIKILIEDVFPAWNVQYVGTWYWIKVTDKCKPICEFSDKVNKKLPFERIIFGCRTLRSKILKNPDPDKIIVSIPSSIHSHKPPLNEILAEYIPVNGRFMEIFARYLLPFWTSCGNEVLKLQLKSLYM